MSTITEKLKWLIDADATSAVKGFEQAGDAADKNLKKAQTASQKLGGTLTKVGAGAVAFSGIAGAALFKAAGAFEDLAISSGKMADATGLSVEQASRWTEVAGDIGISAETIETSLGKMNKTLGATPQKFKDLGIEIAAAKDGTEDVNGTFLNTIDRLQQIKDPAERAAAAATVFGKGWQGAAELLNVSTDDIKKQLASVSDQKVINEEELQKAKDYRADLDHLKDSAEDLALAIGQGAAPIIGGIASAVGSAVEVFSKLDTATHGAAGGILAAGTAALGVVGALAVVAGQALKIKRNLTDAEGALTTFGKAGIGVAGAVGLATIALTGIYVDNAAKKAHLKQVTDDYVDALKQEETGTKGVVATTIAKQLSDKKLIDQATQLGLTTKDLADIVNGKTVPALEAWRDVAEKGHFTTQFLGEDAQKLSVAYFGLTNKLAPMTQGLKDAHDQMVVSKQVTDDLGVSTNEYKDKTEEVVAATDSAQNSIAGYSYAAKDAADTVAGLQSRNKMMTDDLKRGLDADWSAMNRLTGAIDDDEAWLNLQNNIAATTALFDENGNVIVEKGKDAAQAMRDASLSVDGLKKDVIAYATEVLALPVSRVTDIVAIVNPQSLADVEALLAALTRNRNVNLDLVAKGAAGYGVGPHATGGRIPYGESLSLVGEEGPELISAEGATVYTASQTAAMLQPSSSPGLSATSMAETWKNLLALAASNPTYNITINGANMTPEQLVRAIKQYERRNGPAWRT